MSSKNINNSQTIDEQITECKGLLEFVELKLKVKTILLRHNILSLNDIESLQDQVDKDFLQENKNIVKNSLCEILRELTYDSKEFQALRLQILSNQPFYQQMKSNPAMVKKIQSRISAGEMTGNEVLELMGFSNLTEAVLNIYSATDFTTPEDILKRYSTNIDELKNDVTEIHSILSSLKLSVLGLQQEYEYLGQLTYHSLFYGARKKQKGNIIELNKKQEEKNFLVDLIMSDDSISKDEKMKALKNIENEDVPYEIGRWLGKKLSKHERRVLRVLRYTIHSMIKEKRVTGVGKSLYEAEIALSEIYEEYGLVRNKHGKYDYNQTKIIQDILFGLSTKGLHEDILFKHKKIFKTRFILQAEEITQKVMIEKDKVEVEQIQRIGIRIAMPYFLFVSEDDADNYYYLDPIGFKKFMSIKGMTQSEAAFEIAEYLEWYLSSKLEERILDLSTLIEEAGDKLKALYKTRKKDAVNTVKTILNNMVQAGYLIKEYRLGKGASNQEQLTLINLRHKLFTEQREKAKVLQLTKGRARSNNK